MVETDEIEIKLRIKLAMNYNSHVDPSLSQLGEGGVVILLLHRLQLFLGQVDAIHLQQNLKPNLKNKYTLF
jgi:hypothetical protein